MYRAVGETSGTVVAVKLLPLGALATPESRLTLLNEIQAAQQIKHPNVVQVLHVNDGTKSAIGPYVVMEFVSGGNLARVLRAGGQVPLKRAVEMMIDIAQGANAINAKLIHRDIKPDNVLIEGSTLKIGDFGISKFVDESTRLHSFKGGQHVRYMAPEGWEYQTNTIKLDVYSVGLVYYEILTLKHPLLPHVKDPDNFLDWEKAHLYQQCPDVRTLRSDVPLSIAQLLSRMVGKRPGDRPYWDEVLKVLSQPEINSSTKNPTVTAAVEAAVAHNRELQKKELEARAAQDDSEKHRGLYRYACGALLEELNPVIEQFNQEFQHGKITRDGLASATVYHVPQGQNVQLTFFEPRKSGIKIRGNGELIGGGWIGLSKGRSANLLLLKYGADDLYGKWVVCEIALMALVDARKIIGRYGITESTVVPFGFTKADYFYDQMQYTTMMHAFTYTFADNVGEFFAKLIHDAVSSW